MTIARSRLQGCVAMVADRMVVPDRVMTTTIEPDPWIELGPDGRRPRWNQVSLGNGPSGIALLFAELSHHDAAYRRVAHDYLSKATAYAHRVPVGGLYTGLGGIAFAAQAAAQSSGDYATLRSKLDKQIAERVAYTVHIERQRRPLLNGTSFEAYDIISGLTGVGRYLLSRERSTPDTLRKVLDFLVELTEPFSSNLGRPGWWVRHSPTPGLPDEDGHVNFGLAHGIAGPLALLALAWRDGHRVSGHDAAIGRIVSWYLERQGRDDANPFWPVALSAAEYTRGQGPDGLVIPPTWCYGAPGIARAIQLAGNALNEPSWTAAARSIIHTVIARLPQNPGLHETMLCHGWGGLLQALWRINSDLDDPVIAQAIEGVAGRVLEAYDAGLPFGFRAHHMGNSVGLDLPGFLEGAAGTVLAINTYVAADVPRTGWDAALLLA